MTEEPRIEAPRVTGSDTQHRPSAPADDAVVDVRDVHYAIDGRPIFAGLNIRVRRGLITAVMGPSGTGKTTLLRLITGQLFSDSEIGRAHL